MLACVSDHLKISELIRVEKTKFVFDRVVPFVFDTCMFARTQSHISFVLHYIYTLHTCACLPIFGYCCFLEFDKSCSLNYEASDHEVSPVSATTRRLVNSYV